MNLVASRCRAASSATSIATEYASSPVEQAGTQTRTERSSSRLSKIFGRTSRSSASNAARSRKNWVTPISMSPSSALASPETSCR